MEGKDNEKQVLDITSLDIYLLLPFFIRILESQTWQYLGLRVKPGSNVAEKDLDRAKTAIDCISFLVDKLEDHLQVNEKKSLNNLLAELQINFVRLSTS